MTESRSIHVWVGMFRGSDADWATYFDVDGFGSACGFCRDTGVDWFDLDRFSAFNAGAVVPVEDIVIEVPFSEQLEGELLDVCRSFGIGEASHGVTLIDFEGEAPAGTTALGLTSLGVFGFRA